MSKKISEMGPKGSMVDADEFTILDSADANLTTKNKRVLKSVALSGLAQQSAVDAVQANLTSHENTGAGAAHADGATLTDISNHKAGANEHPISGVTGLQTALDEKANSADLGNSATRNVGTLPTEVAAGDAPAAAVTAHEGTYDHTNLPTTAQKAALDANATLSGANAVAGANDLPTANQQAALDAANAPTGLNPFVTDADLTHANLPDTASAGHPGGAINIPAGVEDNAVAIAADGTLKDAGFPPGGWSGLHADLTDKDSDGHPGTVITIPLGVEDNAVAIAADGTLKDSGVPPGGAGGTTNLGHNRTATNVEITSSSGDNTTILGASGTLAGFLTAADKTALDGTDAAGTPRPPTAHANTHATGQGDAIAPADIGAEPAFSKNTAFNRNFGAAINTVCQGNDARLSDARTPTTHAATHAAGQSDELTPAAINAATSAQGALADSATQPGDDAATLGSGAASNGQVLTADGAGNANWQTGGGGGWQDGTTVTDWGLTPQNLGTIAGNTQVDLNNGHHGTGTLSGGDWEIDFITTAGHPVTQWTWTLVLGGQTPVWKFNGVLVDLAEGYDLTGSPSRVVFSFQRDALGVSVSERKIQ